MATQQIEFEAPSGMVLTAKLFLAGSDTAAYTASAVVEQTNRKGIYQATFSNVAANTYQLIAVSGSIGIAAWWGYAENTASTFQFASAIGDLNPGAAGEIADAVWNEPYNQHTTAGTFGKLMDILRKANTTIEGVVTSAITPTATQFSTNVNYPTGALEHCVLFWANSVSINEQNSPIITYTNTNGVIVVEEPFTAAPAVGDEFIIISGSHIHSKAGIADAIWDELIAGHTVSGSYGERVLRSSNSQSTVSVNGSYRIAADLQELQPAVISSSHFAANAIDSNALATSAVTEIVNSIWNEPAASHTAVGSFGKYINDILDDTGTSGVIVAGFNNGAITNTAFATDAINSNALATNAAYKIGDGILTRDMFSVESIAPEHSLCTLVLAALEYSVSGTTWTIKRTDGVTTHLVKTLTPDQNATFVVGVQ